MSFAHEVLDMAQISLRTSPRRLIYSIRGGQLFEENAGNKRRSLNDCICLASLVLENLQSTFLTSGSDAVMCSQRDLGCSADGFGIVRRLSDGPEKVGRDNEAATIHDAVNVQINCCLDR